MIFLKLTPFYDDKRGEKEKVRQIIKKNDQIYFLQIILTIIGFVLQFYVYAVVHCACFSSNKNLPLFNLLILLKLFVLKACSFVIIKKGRLLNIRRSKVSLEDQII